MKSMGTFRDLAPVLGQMEKVTLVEGEGGLEVRGLALRPLEVEVSLRFKGQRLGLLQPVTLPGPLFAGALTAKVESFRLEEGRAVLEGNGFRFDLPPLAEEVEFALLKGEVAGEALDGGFLAQALSAVRHAADRNERAKTPLSGVALDLGPGEVRVVATDGYRLAHVRSPREGNSRGRFVLPPRGAEFLARLLKEGPVAVKLSPGSALFAWETEEYRAALGLPLLGGEGFPDYLPLLHPLPTNQVFPLPRKEALEALRELDFLADPQRPAVLLAEEKGELLFAVEGAYGRGERRLPVKVPKGFRMALYLPFFLDALRFFPGEEVRVQYALGGRPILLQEEQAGGVEYTAVLSPVLV